MAYPARPAVDRFWDKVCKSDGCWEWTASLYPDGYGQFAIAKGRAIRAHRYSWSLANGQPVPSGMEVCHRCDNPKCVRPEHLFVGTRRANISDMMHKRRGNRGARNASAKLTEQQVIEIRELYALGHLQAALAVMYGISRPQVSDIVRGKMWAHADGPIAALGRGRNRHGLSA